MSDRTKKIVLPILVLVVGLVVARALIAAKPEPQRHAPPAIVPLVEAVTARVAPHTFTVRAQGTVAPRTSSALVAEVAGRILSIDESFVDGGFFTEGQVLLTLDDRDYRAAVARAEADVAQARLAIAREEEEARIAREEWERFDREGEPTPLVLREPQLAQARAALRAAEANLARARRDLERTRVRAPYTGRIRAKLVDVGDFLQPGAPAAQIYAVDFAEIRLPLPDEELAYLDLPFDLRGIDASSERGPEVRFRARFAGADHEWTGYLHRTEGEVDERTRMVHVVARVEDPYGRGADGTGTPLSVGMFVDAEIEGRSLDAAIVLPRKVLLRENTVAVVDAASRLALRPVEVLRATDTEIVLAPDALADGAQVISSRLDAVVDGMTVRVVDDRSASATAEDAR